jgi:hypothetical protein
MTVEKYTKEYFEKISFSYENALEAYSKQRFDMLDKCFHWSPTHEGREWWTSVQYNGFESYPEAHYMLGDMIRAYEKLQNASDEPETNSSFLERKEQARNAIVNYIIDAIDSHLEDGDIEAAIDMYQLLDEV